MTLNPVLPALLARAANKVPAVGKDDPTTGDRDIVRRHRFLIDLDPLRPSGISASEEEKRAAIEHGRQVAAALRDEGWPTPIAGDSGNGGHLVYRIDLPAEDSGLVQHALEAIDFRYSDAAVKIDTSVANPARICKVYGTAARKGDSTADRPHRLSRITYVPPAPEIVTEEKLRAVAAWRPRPEPTARNTTGESFDIEGFIARNGLELRGPHSWQGGRKWIFRVCPWNSDHTNRAAYVVQFSSGAIAAGCHHDGCQGKGWRELRLLFEPDAYSKPGAEWSSAAREDNGADKRAAHGMTFTRIGDLLSEADEAITWIVEEFLSAGGFSAVVAKPKVGKSTLARCLALAVARGEPFLGRATTKGPVLYLALEESQRQVTTHFRALGATDEDDVHIYAGSAPPEALIKLRAAISEHRPLLVIIDTLFRLTRVKDANDYAQVMAALEPLLAIARELGMHVMFLHHSPKGAARQAVEAALGSISITGSVDIVIALRKTENYRTLITEQREGDGFSEEVTLDFDPNARRVSLGATRKATDEAEVAQAIVEWLKTRTEPVREDAIHEAVEARRATKQRVLRRLVEEGRMVRTGTAKKGDPYLYAAAPSVSDEPHENAGTVVPNISGVPANPKSGASENVAPADLFSPKAGSRDSDDSEPTEKSRVPESGALDLAELDALLREDLE